MKKIIKYENINPAKNPELSVEEIDLKDIAIIGIGLRLMDYTGTEDLWNDLITSQDKISRFPENRKADTTAMLVRQGKNNPGISFSEQAYLDSIDAFDRSFFRISPKEAMFINPGHRIFLETAWRAVEDAGYGGDRLKNSSTGVYLGIVPDRNYSDFVYSLYPDQADKIFVGNVPSNAASRISYILDWHGPAVNIDTACSSSLVAVHLACRALRNRECDVALAGGVNINLLPVAVSQEIDIISADGRTRTFDESSDGTGGGEGVLAILLKPLTYALRDHDHIHAVIKGSAVNNDGDSAGMTVPNAKAQADVIRTAWKDAGISPESIGYIEAHGTGTRLGDPIEIDGIQRAFSNYSRRKQFIPIGSVKSNFGHLDAAAGILGLIKSVLCLRNRKIPPIVHFRSPNKNIPFADTPVYPCAELMEWKKDDLPRRCGISSFGLSGTNCHVILEEAPELESQPEDRLTRNHLFTLSARDSDALKRYAELLFHFLEQTADLSLPDVCFTLNSGRGHYNHRIAIVVPEISVLRKKLQFLLEKGLRSDPAQGIFYHQFMLVPENSNEEKASAFTQKSIRTVSAETRELIKQFLDEPKETLLSRIAEKYVNGADIDWEHFYPPDSTRRVSLPPYPFEKKRCWPDLSATIAKEVPRYSSRYSDFRPAVFLKHLLAESEAMSVFSIRLDPETDWVLKEHRIAGKPTLVGAAYFQILFEAAEYLGYNNGFEINELQIRKTLTTEKAVEILLILHRQKQEVRAVFQEKDENSGWIDYASARLSKLNSLPDKPVDLDEIRNQYSSMLDVNKEDLRRAAIASAVQTSERWHCLNRVYSDGKQKLGQFSLPGSFRGDLPAYRMHPGMLDVAMSLNLQTPGFFPAAGFGLRIYKPLPPEIYSHIRKKVSDSAKSLEFSITLTDMEGNILADFERFLFLRSERELPAAAALVRKIRWSEIPGIEYSATGARPDFLLIGRGSAFQRLRENLMKQAPGFSVFDLADEPETVTIVAELQEKRLRYILFLSDLDRGTLAIEDLYRFIQKDLLAVFDLAGELTRSPYGGSLNIMIAGMNTWNVSGTEAELNPHFSMLAGLGSVIGIENQNVKCRFVDLDTAESAENLPANFDLIFALAYQKIAIRSAKLFAENISRREAASQAGKVCVPKEQGVYLITGGLSGIGLEIARHFSRQKKVKLALLARSKFPKREDWPNIIRTSDDERLRSRLQLLAGIVESGSELLILSADVADAEQITAALEKIHSSFGKINGVIHCAGVAGDGFIFRKSADAFLATLAPKVQGSWLLDRLTREDHPDFFLLCSALTALTGAPGQSDYTAANCFLDAFADFRQKAGQTTVAINWPAWKETGMAFNHDVVQDTLFYALDTRDALAGLSGISTDHGTRVIIGELNGELIRSLEIDLPIMIEAYATKSITTQDIHPEGAAIEESVPERTVQLTGRDDGAYSDTERIVAGVWADILGYEEINVFEDYFGLGGDSIDALEIGNEFSKRFGLNLSIDAIYKNATIVEYAAFINDQRPAAQSAKRRPAGKVVISKSPKAAHYPVSASQRRLYFFYKFLKDNTAYNLPLAWKLEGNVDPRRLEAAFQQLIDRNEILRTRFDLYRDEPVQIVEDQLEFHIPVIDSSEDQLEARVAQFIQPFDLAACPLIRAELLRFSDRQSVLLFDIHHIIADAMSLDIIMMDLIKIYHNEELREQTLQFRDYAVWEHDYLTSDQMKSHHDYWMNRFSTDPPILDFPLDFPRPAVSEYSGDVTGFELESGLFERVKTFARGKQSTPFTVLVSALVLTLYRYTGQEDIVIGIAENGRHLSELEKMIGMFINNLPIRSFPHPDQTVDDFFNDLKKTVIEAFEHKNYPFDELVEKLNPYRDTSRNPIFDIVFSYLNFHEMIGDFKTSEFSITPYQSLSKNSSKYDIAIFATEYPDKVFFGFEYYSAIFRKESIEQFGRVFRNILNRMIADPQQTISEIDLIDGQEQDRILREFNDGRSDYPKDKDVATLFEEQVESCPDRLAVVDQYGKLSYRELNEKANRIANYLLEKNRVEPEEPIAILMDRGSQMIAAVLAVLKSGGAYVPMDAAFPSKRIGHILQDTGCRIILTDTQSEQSLAAMDLVVETLLVDEIESGNSANPQRVSDGESLAYIMYTSGSTGIPKGVMIEQHSIARLVLNTNYIQVSPEDRILEAATLAFDASTFEIWAALLNGACLYPIPKMSLLDFAAFKKFLRKHQITRMWLTAGLFNRVTDEDIDILGGLQTVLLGGERLSMTHVNRVRERFPDLELINGYGPTENTTFSTCFKIERSYPGDIPIGKPVSNSTIMILNESNRLAAIGVPGELCCGGDGLARGYLNDNQRTLQKFVANPFHSSERLYRTGDRARWLPDGNIEFLGRLDKQLKIRGFRVEPGEIEYRMNQHPAIKNSVVIALDGLDGNRELCAYFVTKDAKTLHSSVIRSFLQNDLPVYMLPSLFIQLEEFNLTANGKVDLRALPDPLEFIGDADSQPLEAQNDTEKQLVNIWKKILGRGKIGVSESFFALGGHSLKAIQVLNMIHEELGVDISMKELFTALSIEKISRLIMERKGQAVFEIPAAPPAEYYPVSFAQQRLWFLQHLPGAKTAYNILGYFIVSSGLDLQALEKAFRRMIERHETLRTEFVQIEGSPHQKILPAVDFKIERIDRGANYFDDDKLREFMRQELGQEFDLTQAPLLRVKTIRLPGRSYMILYTINHIVCDGWSTNVLRQELATLYLAYTQGRPDPLKALALQYKDFAAWQKGLDFQKEEEYWLNELKGVSPLLELPLDKNTIAEDSFRGATEILGLDDDLYTRIHSYSAERGVTVANFLLAIYFYFLFLITKTEDICLSIASANRFHPDLENIIGFFINLLPIRIRIDDEMDFPVILDQVVSKSREALEHQIYPFDLLIRKVNPERWSTNHPLTNVGFEYQQFHDMRVNIPEEPDVARVFETLLVKEPRIDYLDSLNETTKGDMTLFVIHKDRTIDLQFEYDTSKFHRETIREYLEYIRKITEMAMANPHD